MATSNPFAALNGEAQAGARAEGAGRAQQRAQVVRGLDVVHREVERRRLEAAARVDAAVYQAAEACVGAGAFADALTQERLRLPARMYGGGLRSQAETAPEGKLDSPRTDSSSETAPALGRAVTTPAVVEMV